MPEIVVPEQVSIAMEEIAANMQEHPLALVEGSMENATAVFASCREFGGSVLN